MRFERPLSEHVKRDPLNSNPLTQRFWCKFGAEGLGIVCDLRRLGITASSSVGFSGFVVNLCLFFLCCGSNRPFVGLWLDWIPSEIEISGSTDQKQLGSRVGFGRFKRVFSHLRPEKPSSRCLNFSLYADDHLRRICAHICMKRQTNRQIEAAFRLALALLARFEGRKVELLLTIFLAQGSSQTGHAPITHPRQEPLCIQAREKQGEMRLRVFKNVPASFGAVTQLVM